ncbi:hypothetical protein [Helicobacter cynogastricus]|uniref:hypothetical protein n=1 Tax=Helicobacter cynogastricus TaxID=329937 RepID=UPI000CF0FCA4|nr:hypothetical protein [Helicobacter cynogastricus]
MGIKIQGLVGFSCCIVALGSVLHALDSARVKECYKVLGEECGLWTKGFDQIQKIVIHPVKIDLTQEQIKAIQGSEEIKGCLAWHFNPKSLKKFFKRSETYESSPYIDYEQFPCYITGSFVLEGQKYIFDIDGGGSFTIQDRKGKVYYLGCSPLLYGAVSGDTTPNPKCAKFLPDF